MQSPSAAPAERDNDLSRSLRYLVRIEVYDNTTKRTLVDEAFNTPHLIEAERACRRATDALQRAEAPR